MLIDFADLHPDSKKFDTGWHWADEKLKNKLYTWGFVCDCLNSSGWNGVPDSSRKLARINDFGRTKDIWVMFKVYDHFKKLQKDLRFLDIIIWLFLAGNCKVKHANLAQNQSKGEQFASLTLHPSKPNMLKGMSPKKSASLPGDLSCVFVKIDPITLISLSSNPEIKSIPHQPMLLWKYSEQLALQYCHC